MRIGNVLIVGRDRGKGISTGMQGMDGIGQGFNVKGNGTQIKSDASHTQIFADQAKPILFICHGPTRTNADKINCLEANPENGLIWQHFSGHKFTQITEENQKARGLRP
jgi:hypothetical protein